MLASLAAQAVDSMLASPARPCNCDDVPPMEAALAVEDLPEWDDEHEVVLEAAGGMPGNLTAYWARGEGAAKIRWGTDGAFDRCVKALGEHVDDPKGACANLEKNATGSWPGSSKVESTMSDTITAASPIPPNEDSNLPPNPPGDPNEPPMDVEEEKEEMENEKVQVLEDRISRLEQDVARILAVTNPELEEI